MEENQLTCLIVGETPAAQFLGWRLSLSNSFIILVSQYVSSDELVAWKSTKLGANFYTPNIFTKDIKELHHKLKHNGANTYSIDIVLVSAISLQSFKTTCRLLSDYTNDNTTVLISTDFGCEMEPIAISYFGGKCKCVISISCEVECRQLSLGSYALVNDDQCVITLGLTYCDANFEANPTILENTKAASLELQGIKGSNVRRFLLGLTVAKWMKSKLILDPKQMALKMWELLIPKISLNILSIIYEQFDYEKMLENKSTEIIFKDLVKELLGICFAQCGSKIARFLLVKSQGEEEINFGKIVEYCKGKKLQLINSTANEHPEYLSLPFEPYCFYHRFEYPAQILLHQPIILAKKYGVSCSNLNFLYGFYTRLLTLSGLSINGGRCEHALSMLDSRIGGGINVASGINSGQDFTDGDNKDQDKGKNRVDKNVKEGSFISLTQRFTMTSPLGVNDPALPADLEKLYLGAEYISNCDANTSGGQKRVKSPTKADTGYDDKHLPDDTIHTFEDEYLADEDDFSCLGIDKRSSTKPTKPLEKFGVVAVPHFIRRFSIKRSSKDKSNDMKRPYTTSSLELQLRSNHFMFAKEYQDLHRQLYYEVKPRTQSELDARRRNYAELESQMWKIKHRFNIHRGALPRPRTNPYELLLDHIDVLNRGNTGDILRFTTSRYGGVDTYDSILRDQSTIMELLDKRCAYSPPVLFDNEAKERDHDRDCHQDYNHDHRSH
ncbi:BCN_G0036380.mRNA.1.CDS.1 [Saccharomyces cerevisiae]|nr:BCN_G0036380.mRNA.1.CDS.1 [Saccharomyces cerevisiae]CAI4635962.1 BCE_3a_G0036400.mRNA.1.CDS.1 [Saccharomyces cerevisiae]CAI7229921.1 BCN_G0036380.mRNA.1.CDS.1 [Saccharomyces cerevisiae]CAI7233831.1 BCE_3a_G0036400.mRNA.1.CDS.1 [Saccharomyces cerevisiae]